MIPSDVYTFTLNSSYVLTVSTTADFGEVFITKMFLSLAAVLVLDMLFVLVYRQ